MTHWKKLTNPNYLGSWDLQKGEERTLTISSIVQEEIFNQNKNAKEQCIVAHFVDKSKPMVLNKTNCKTIQGLYGTPNIEEWKGKRITLEVQKVKAFGKLEEALRVKNKKPSGEPPKQSEPPTNEFVPPCDDCGCEITAFKNYTASMIANRNADKYGMPLCVDCAAERKKKEE